MPAAPGCRRCRKHLRPCPGVAVCSVSMQFRRICHASPARGGIASYSWAAAGAAVITPQHRSERMPQGSVSSLWTGVSKFHCPPRSHRARCAKPGPGLTLIARPACPSPPKAGGLGGASCAAGTRVLCLQYRVFNFRCTSEGQGKMRPSPTGHKMGFSQGQIKKSFDFFFCTLQAF